MQQMWTERAIKGAKLFAVGGVFTLANDTVAAYAKGNLLAMLAVNLIFGVVAPIVMLWGLYLIGTRNKQVATPAKE